MNDIFKTIEEYKNEFIDVLKKNKTQPDSDRISKTLSGRKNLQSLLKRIDTVEEFRDLVLSIFDQNTELYLDPSDLDEHVKYNKILLILIFF